MADAFIDGENESSKLPEGQDGGGAEGAFAGSGSGQSPKVRMEIWLLLIGGLLIAGMAALQVKSGVDRVAEQKFAALSDEVRYVISRRLDDHARILLAGAALFNASDTVTREQWRVFTRSQKVETQLPGIQGIGFALLVPRSGLSRHIQEIRAEGFPDYAVRPEGDREFYSSIIYLQPFSGRNLRAFGYDMLSEPVRRAAMERARDTDSATLSGKVVLVQETDRDVQAGTLMYVPVYRKGMPTDSVEQRRAAILGWVYSPYRMNDLMRGMLGDGLFRDRRLRLSVFDGQNPFPPCLLYESTSAPARSPDSSARFTRQTTITFNGRCWTLCFEQAGPGIFAEEYMPAWLTLIGGVLISILLSALMRTLLETRGQALRMAAEMTASLRQNSVALRQTTQRLSLAARAGGVGIWDWDVVGNRLVWDGQMCRLHGIAPDQFGGDFDSWMKAIHLDDRRRCEEEVRVALREAKDFETRFRIVRPDGAVRHLCCSASVQRDVSGWAVRLIGTSWDVTAQTEAEESIRRQAGLINSLLDSMPDIIFFKDVNGRYLGCNPPFVEFVGRPREAIVGRTDEELFGAAVAGTFRENDRRVLELRRPRHNEEWIIYPDGRKVLVDTLKTPYLGPDGGLIGILGVSRDITARKQAEEALRKSEEQVTLLLNSTAEAIYGIDLEGNCTFANPSCVRMLGYADAGSLLGKNMHELIHHSHRDGRPLSNGECRIYQAFRKGQNVHVDDEVLWRVDGTCFPAEYWSYPVAVNGTVSGSVVTFVDITARRQAEEALQESEANFRTFFETMTDMIIVAAPDGRMLFTNAAVPRMLGYAREELGAMRLLDLHPADRRTEAAEIFAAMLRGDRESCPLPLAAKSGALIPVDTRVWLGKWNGVDCIFGICKDLRAEQEAKQRFERLFRSNPNPIALSTLPDRRFMDVNEAFLKKTGYAREEIVGKTSAEIGLFLDPDESASVSEKLVADGRISDFEMRLRRRDGTVREGLFWGEVFSSQDRPYLLTVMIDITDRKRAERELARLSGIQRELMRLATDFVNVPMERQDAAINQSLETMGRLIRADRAYLFAYDFAAGVMNNTHEWCGPGITPEIGNLQAVPNDMIPAWVEAHRRGETVHVPSVAALPADGNLRRILEPQGIRSLVTLPLMQGGVCLGFVGFDAVREERAWREEDVSLLRVLAELYAHFEARRAAEQATRELQKDLMQARDAAQEAARAKSLFLANMSHEIRTPLNAILGYAQIMERECKACPVVWQLNAISRSGEHLLTLVTDLMELVRSDERAVVPNPCEFDFYALLEDVRLMFLRHPEGRSLTLEANHAPEVPRLISADQGKIRQILVNLAGNAVKFTKDGYVRLLASVAAAGGDGVTIAVDVEDTGCGIPEEERERIFNLFELGAGSVMAGKGTGLGLPLSRRYARALGGDITVSSRVGAGSCFRFTFKAVRAATCEQPPRPRRLLLEPGRRPPHVLVVDDDPANREMFTAMLESIGCRVETASGAELALARLELADGVDVVLMDKCMPGMDGIEAVARIRQMPAGHAVPVLIVTASGFGDERKQALAAGADGHIAKPVRMEQLLEEVARLSGLRCEYAAPPSISAAAPAVSAEAESLACLTAEQRHEFGQALRRGDIRHLRRLAVDLAQGHAGLAAAIGALLDVYDYDGLHCLLDLAEENAP